MDLFAVRWHGWNFWNNFPFCHKGCFLRIVCLLWRSLPREWVTSCYCTVGSKSLGPLWWESGPRISRVQKSETTLMGKWSQTFEPNCTYSTQWDNISFHDCTWGYGSNTVRSPYHYVKDLLLAWFSWKKVVLLYCLWTVPIVHAGLGLPVPQTDLHASRNVDG